LLIQARKMSAPHAFSFTLPAATMRDDDAALSRYVRRCHDAIAARHFMTHAALLAVLFIAIIDYCSMMPVRYFHAI